MVYTMWCSNLACRARITLSPTCPAPMFCAACGGSNFQSWEPGTFPSIVPRPTPDADDACGVPFEWRHTPKGK